MRILALDLSTKTGFAILNDDKIEAYGRYFDGKSISVPEACTGLEEYTYIFRAKKIGQFAAGLALKYNPDVIAIEQTNRGRARGTQKQLEMIHYGVLEALMIGHLPSKIVYVDTSQWRAGLKIYLSKDQKKHNKAVREKKIRGKITSKHLAVSYANSHFGLSLKMKDNDAADALMIALFIFNKAKKPIPVANIDKALFSNDG